MRTNLYYYSVVTLLAVKIAEKYYRDIHFVWCSPKFNCVENPPSSNPKDIFRSLKEDVNRFDLHSSKIKENKAGLRKGARVKKETGVISEQQYKEILSIIQCAKVESFQPLLCIIHAESVKHIVKEARPLIKANLLSLEYLIDTLRREQFDLIEL